MKRIIFISLIISISIVKLQAQWIQGSSSLCYNGGRVGIGCESTFATLKIDGGAFPLIELGQTLQIAVATQDGFFAGGAKAGDAVIRKLGSSHNILLYMPNNAGDGSSGIKFGDEKNGVFMGIYNNKTVRLDGILYATEVRVQANAWADEVFEKDYNLRTLGEVEAFIEKYKHLPEIPAQSDIVGKDYNVAEMNRLLLKKVEELSLYVISQDKRIRQLEKKQPVRRKR